MKRFGITEKRVLLVIGVVVLFFLMLDFNNRMSELLMLSGERDRMAVQVTALAGTATAVADKINYATSDAAVFDFARNNYYAKPGDIPIVPVSPGGSLPTPTPTPQPTTATVENWEIWFALFLDKR